MIGFLTTTLNVPGLVSWPINLGWLALLGCLLYAGPQVGTRIHQLFLLFLGYALITLFWTPDLLAGWIKFFQLALIFGAFLWGFNKDSLRNTYIGLGIGITVSALLALAQAFGYEDIWHEGLAGLFGNSSTLGQTAALVLIALVLERLWWLVPGPVLAIGLSQSRGAWLVLAIGALLAWRNRVAGYFALAAIAVAGAIWFGRQPDFRPEIWGEIIRAPDLWGHGLGSFSYTSFNWTVVHAHNDPLEFFSELGIAVAFPAVAIVLAFDGGDRAERVLLGCLLALSLFAFPLFIPATGFLFGALLGQMAQRSYHAMEIASATLSIGPGDRVGIQGN